MPTAKHTIFHPILPHSSSNHEAATIGFPSRLKYGALEVANLYNSPPPERPHSGSEKKVVFKREGIFHLGGEYKAKVKFLVYLDVVFKQEEVSCQSGL